LGRFGSLIRLSPIGFIYLHSLAKACEEAADEPRVRPLLFKLLLAAPLTLAQLVRAERQAERRLAA